MKLYWMGGALTNLTQQCSYWVCSLLLACRCKILMHLPWRTESLRLPEQVVLYDWFWKWIFGCSVLVLNLIMCLQMTCFYKYLWKGFLEILSQSVFPKCFVLPKHIHKPIISHAVIALRSTNVAQPYTGVSFVPRFLEIIFICFTQK